MNQEELDKQLDQELTKLLEENSVKTLSFFILQFGRHMVDANAEELRLSVHATLSGKRYKVTCVSTVEEITKNPPNVF